MSEWWTYRLSSFLLFSPRTYWRMFELHNRALWPLQLVALAAGLVLVGALARRPAWAARGAAFVLGAAWASTAWVFLWRRYAAINWAAAYFALAFALEAAAWLVLGLRGRRVALAARDDLGTRAGVVLAAAGVAAYPGLAGVLGRGWRAAEIFALTPDPTVLVTLGALLVVERRHRLWLLPIPLLWCATTGATLAALHAPECWLLPAVGLAVLVLALRRSSSHG